MRTRQPISHWNNFTIPELKEILIHCRALEKLGIAQDEEMMISIERDVTMRKIIINQSFDEKLAKTKQTGKSSLVKISKKEQPHELLLEQTA
jgi:hypothetical protein